MNAMSSPADVLLDMLTNKEHQRAMLESYQEGEEPREVNNAILVAKQGIAHAPTASHMYVRPCLVSATVCVRMCMCTCVRVCMYACVRACVRACMCSVCMCMKCACMCVCVRVCVRACVVCVYVYEVYACGCIVLWVQTCVHVLVCVHVYSMCVL